MNTTSTRINPYFQATQAKPQQALRSSFNFDKGIRGNSQQVSQKTGGFRFYKQISPDQTKYQNETPSSKAAVAQQDYSYQIAVSADEKSKHQESTNTANSNGSSNMKKSPSFRLKSYKRPTSKYVQQKSEISKQDKKDEPQIRNERISHLESYVQNLNQQDEYSSPKHDIKHLIPNLNMNTPGFTSEYSTNLTILDETETNIEELHFHLVEFQQKCKQWFMKIEDKKTVDVTRAKFNRREKK